MRAFPQMQTQAIKIKCKIATEFPVLSAQPPLSLVQSQALGNSDTTYNPDTRKKLRWGALLCFRNTINVQIKWEKCLFTEIPIRGLWPGKDDGPGPGVRGSWPWHSGDTGPAWPSHQEQPVSINCNNNGHWTQAGQGWGETRSRYNLCTTWHYKTQPEPCWQTGFESSDCSPLTSTSLCQYWLVRWVSHEIWGAGHQWPGCTDCTVCRASQSCKVGPDNLSCQSYFVSISVSLSLEGRACDHRSLCLLQPPLSHPHPGPARPPTLRDPSKLVDSLQIEKVQLNRDPNGPAY